MVEKYSLIYFQASSDMDDSMRVKDIPEQIM